MNNAQSHAARTSVLCGVALMAAAVTGCGSVTSPSHSGASATSPGTDLARSVASTAAAAAAAPPLAAGKQGSRQQVPWSQVGPGWFLTEWSRTPPHGPGQPAPAAPTTLFLVDPAGGRYQIETFPANAPQSAPDRLVAWSGDGQRALLEGDGSDPTVRVLTMRTLASTTFRLGDFVTPIGFTSPDGLAIIATKGFNSTSFERFSLTGKLELSYPAPMVTGTYNGTPLYSPDGTELAVGTSGGMEVMSNDGHALRLMVLPAAAGTCRALRWWAPGEVLAGCLPGGSTDEQLWVVPTNPGPAPWPLTATPPAPGDLGDLDAWQVRSGTFVEDAGACGLVYLAKLGHDGLTSRVDMPTIRGASKIGVLGTDGDRLAIEGTPACGSGGTLVWYSPASNSITPLIGFAAQGGSVSNVVMYRES